MLTWAFIYTLKGCKADSHQAVIDSPGSKTLIYGVETVEEGCELAQKIVAEGCKLIELCGGFGEAGAKKVSEAVEGKVPVGYIDYLPGDAERVKQL